MFSGMEANSGGMEAGESALRFDRRRATAEALNPHLRESWNLVAETDNQLWRGYEEWLDEVGRTVEESEHRQSSLDQGDGLPF